MPSGANTKTISGAPQLSTNYVVIGSHTTCPATTKKTITVLVRDPIVEAEASKETICVGENNTLSASGAINYSWTPAGNGSTTIVTPEQTGTAVYSVTGADDLGCKKTATVSFMVDECTGISQHMHSPHDIKIYNSLADGLITLESSSACVLEIYNLQGICVQHISTQPNQRSVVNPLPAGVYVVRRVDEQGRPLQKFVILK